MTFKQWLYSEREAVGCVGVKGQWGLAHILTLIFCIASIIVIALIFRKKSEKARKIVLFTLVGLILFFEITRRIINFTRGNVDTLNEVLHTLLPRPWCAISCWVLIVSVIVNKKFFYNFASISALICSIAYFAYPGVGFNWSMFLFEDIYSIVSHCLLIISSITLITLKFTKFEYKTMWKEMICLGITVVYALFETFVLHIEEDPMYFLPSRGSYHNDIMEVLNVNYGVFIFLYILFMVIYINMFYLIADRKNVQNFFKSKKRV